MVQHDIGEPTIGQRQRIIGVKIDGLLKQVHRALIVTWFIATEMPDPTQDTFIGGKSRLAPALVIRSYTPSPRRSEG